MSAFTGFKKFLGLFRTQNPVLLTASYGQDEYQVPSIGLAGEHIVRIITSTSGGGDTSVQLLVAGNDVDGVNTIAFGSKQLPVVTNSNLYALNSTGNFDRLRTIADNSNGQAALGIGTLGTVTRLQALNHVTNLYDRIYCDGNDHDDTVLSTGLLMTKDHIMLFNGTSFVRARSTSASVQSSYTNHVGITTVANAGNWSITHDPALNTQATITRAAGGANTRHVCTSIHASLSATAATAILKVYLRDGASDAGPILWSASIICAANTMQKISISGLSIVGSVNTPMTLEFSAAPGAGNQENVSLTGYTVS